MTRIIRQGDEGRSVGYDAFLSYSRALDGVLGPRFQRELERFATPRYRIRTLRVFRDTASLTANPGLWSSIEQALTESAWFVLLASPEAARSRWVDREVSWWLANRPAERLLIVLTSGEAVWDEGTGDFDWAATTALPRALSGVLAEEPGWVDLRWLREADQVDRANPRLRDCVADVVGAIRQIPKDLLVGEHIRRHRQAMRLAWSGVTTLSVLLVMALVFAFVAVNQWESAVQQQRTAQAESLLAEQQRDLATFNQITRDSIQERPIQIR